jgi:hypothetical protein
VKFITVSVLLLFLLGNSAFTELTKFPILIHHYQEHKLIDSENSFYDFLAEHYALEINHADDEHNDHENLPFKTQDYQSVHVAKIIEQLAHTFLCKTSEFISLLPYKIVFFFCNDYLSCIWQPPRVI